MGYSYSLKIVFLVSLAMASLTLMVGGLSVAISYNSSMEWHRTRLINDVNSYASLVDASYHTLSLIPQQNKQEADKFSLLITILENARNRFPGFGKTGELAIATGEEQKMRFLLRLRHNRADNLVLTTDSGLGRPMVLGLQGRSGTLIGHDYRGLTVLAAYRPLLEESGRHVAIVAKIDLEEIRAPFWEGALTIGLVAACMVIPGSILFGLLGRPILQHLQNFEQALQVSTEEYQATFNCAVVGIARIKEDGTFLQVNPAFCRMLGYSRKQILRRTLGEITHPDDRKSGMEGLRRLIDGKTEIFATQRRYLKANNGILYAHVTVSIIRFSDGKIRHFVKVFDDISERIRREEDLERSEKRFRLLAAQAPISIFCCDSNGLFTFLNPVAINLLGYEDSRWPNKTLGEMLYPDEEETAHQFWRDFQIARRTEGEYLHITTSGEQRWFLLHLTLEGGEDQSLGAVGTLTDITPLKELEKHLLEANTELEQFAYVASHDLQEPLRTLTSYLQLMDDDLADGNAQDVAEDMRFIYDAAARMRTLIRDLLDFSRIGRVALKLEEVPLNDVMLEVWETLSGLMEESGASVTWDVLPTVVADRVQILRVIMNLVTNGLKFHASEDRPTCHVSASEEDNHWKISVKDNGIGIEPQYFERIFMPFQRLHGRGDFSGTGIGLSIVQKIILRHCGKIGVISGLERGSVFWFTLPIRGGSTDGDCKQS